MSFLRALGGGRDLAIDLGTANTLVFVHGEGMLIDEPIAAALGAGLDISEPSGLMVIDVGGGTSEVAVLSMGGIVVSTSMRIGGYTLDEAIVDFVKNEHRLAVGARTAEEVKLRIGSAHPVGDESTTELRGRDMISGLPTKLMLTGDEVRAALAPTLSATVDGVKETLDR